MKNMIDLYAALDEPDFSPSNIIPGQKKKVPVKKDINMKKKPINNNNLKNNFNKNIKQVHPINKNINITKKPAIKNKNVINNNPYDNLDKDNFIYDDVSSPINNDPLSIFSSPYQKEYNEEDEKNIIPGKEDIKSKIDINKIESIVDSLDDKNYIYKSIEEFQDILKKTSKNNNLNTEESQAFLVYCWITKNISYYIGPKPDNTPIGALKKRITQCSGYSRLFKEALKIFGIKSVLIHGIGRTYNLSLKSHRENHEWNAIKINGKYYLCEVTWGAGKVENNKFIKGYNTFYFCCPPEIFICTHYPTKELNKWMLLDKKISQDEFENILYKDKFFYFYNFVNISPSEGIVKLTNKNNIQIKFENLSGIKRLRLSCKVIHENKLIENASYIEKFENYFLVNLILNKRGNYNVLYFVTDKTGTVNSDLIARQQFLVTADSKEMKTFPTILTFPDELHIIEPKYNNLSKNKEILFKFSSEEIDDMGIVINKKCTHLEKSGNIFEGKFTVTGDEILVGKFDKINSGNLKVMIKYQVKNKFK